jgi:mono/diheme cytochrome c family protein
MIPPRFQPTVFLAPLFLTVALAAPAAPGKKPVDFSRQIQPLLLKHCSECHGGVKKKGGLSFLNRNSAFTQAKSGDFAIVEGDPGKSQLIHRIQSSDEDERMPPKEALAKDQIALLNQWIKEGANWPQQWSLDPIKKPPTPPVKDKNWPKNAIDHFVLARLESEKIAPSAEADRPTLIRRLTLDLTGLLPTPAEVLAFDQDKSPDAYQKVVDRLLQSQHFGERWGRHWLDEARYADSAGYEKDSTRADAYRWRDWVIKAINDDMPFDQFTIKQIAGDLLPNATRQDRLATAFHLMTQFNLEGGVDAEEDRTKRVIDRINTIGSVWLGASIGCTQCHDHPYDSYTQKDFYQLYAFFNNTDFEAIYIDEFPDDAEKKIIERHEEWKNVKDLLDRQVTDKNLATQLQGALSKLRDTDNARGITRVLVERNEKRRDTYLFSRGNFLTPNTKLGKLQPSTSATWPPLKPRPRFEKLTEEQKKKKVEPKPLAPDRLDLANWIVSKEHPMTSRVTVNKIWQHLFGEALSTQPQDFGAAGEAPSHGELLDWMASYFMNDAQWSRKKMIREIVLSATYRQSSDYRDDLAGTDPGNRLLARQNRFRVEAEIVRDLYLQAAGLLSPKVGGPSVFPPIPADVAAISYANNFKWNVSKGEDLYRRGMYTFYKRTAPDPNLVLFDCPDAAVTNQLRNNSNTPLQALATLQNEVFFGAAKKMAIELANEKSADEESRLRSAFLTTMGRPATSSETQVLLQLLKQSREWYLANPNKALELIGDEKSTNTPPEQLAAWISTTRIILNTDEFITRS